MPTYDYLCENCGVFEIFHSMLETKTECPTCGKPIKKQLSTGAGIIFKGSGFYQTDYRSESYKKAAEKDKGPAKETPSKSESKKEPPSTSQKKD